MHPNYGGGDPRIHGKMPPPLLLSLTSLAKTLKKDAGNSQASIDVFGWTPGLLLSTRNRQGPMTPIKTMARLQKILAEENVPDAVAFLLSAGGLTALNKIPEKENFRRQQASMDPKLRPINSGSLLLKNTFRGAAKSPSGYEAKLKTRPTQFGCGSKGGMETMALASSAAYQRRMVVHTDDAQNAFNAMKRSAIIQAADKLWPESLNLLNKYYGKRAPVFYTFFKGGERRLRVIWSVEGARMGCVLGSLSFDLAAEEFIYRHLKTEFPQVTHMAPPMT